jgi:hypothetical protein
MRRGRTFTTLMLLRRLELVIGGVATAFHFHPLAA